MNISEFARERGLNPNTVSLYIRRNSSKFDGHLTPSRTGNSLELDEIALELLDKKYPRPQQVQVLEHDPELERKIADQNEMIRQLQAKIIQLTEKNSDLEHQLGDVKLYQYQLAESEKKIENVEERANKAEEQLTKITARLDKAERRAVSAEQEANSYVRSWFGFYRKLKKKTQNEIEIEKEDEV